jgi:hypothetical protein
LDNGSPEKKVPTGVKLNKYPETENNPATNPIDAIIIATQDNAFLFILTPLD